MGLHSSDSSPGVDAAAPGPAAIGGAARSTRAVQPPAPGRLTLTLDDRRALAPWAADCAERVLGIFEAAVPADPRPRAALAGLRAFGAGKLRVGPARALSVTAHAAARSAGDPGAIAAARAAGHAVATAHMGAHARGAAGYAVLAIARTHPGDPGAADEELDRQVRRLTPAARAALRRLPPPPAVGGGELGQHLRDLDRTIRASEPGRDR